MEKIGLIDNDPIYCLLLCNECKQQFSTLEKAMAHCEETLHTISGETRYATTITYGEGEIIREPNTTTH